MSKTCVITHRLQAECPVSADRPNLIARGPKADQPALDPELQVGEVAYQGAFITTHRRHTEAEAREAAKAFQYVAPTGVYRIELLERFDPPATTPEEKIG